MSVQWQDALCPQCSSVATGLGPVGHWQFECFLCSVAWGHPQIHYSEGPAAVIADAQAAILRGEKAT